VIRWFGTRHGDEYKKGSQWFGGLLRRKERYDTVAKWSVWILFLGILAAPVGGLIIAGVGLAGLVYGATPDALLDQLRRRASPGLRSYWQALNNYDDDKRAAEAAVRQAAHKAAQEAELRKRSYWTVLDGYGFERATAEVLNKHQFHAKVTPGSGDGGVDIQVTRNGRRGVVQCKAHTACVGPHVVRDLYGVIHHSRASFGIIVSLGGFTKGAVDFARDKPILFVDLDDLIAMQEGQDVLAAAFAPKQP
jgi:restriction system protein